MANQRQHGSTDLAFLFSAISNASSLKESVSDVLTQRPDVLYTALPTSSAWKSLQLLPGARHGCCCSIFLSKQWSLAPHSQGTPRSLDMADLLATCRRHVTKCCYICATAALGWMSGLGGPQTEWLQSDRNAPQSCNPTTAPV